MADNNNNANNSIFGGESKSKVIETQDLRIHGHLLRWSDTAIQISNISLVSTADLPLPVFPWWSIVIILGGLTLLSDRSAAALGFLAILVAGLWIYLWYRKYTKLKNMKYLHIYLNSGYRYSFIFTNPNFMAQVLQVFANIFESGLTSDTNIVINAQGNEIRENGAVVSLNVER